MIIKKTVTTIIRAFNGRRRLTKCVFDKKKKQDVFHYVSNNEIVNYIGKVLKNNYNFGYKIIKKYY